MNFSFLPNSIVNNAANPADNESPYSFLAFIQYQDYNSQDIDAQLKEYQSYINLWGSKKNLKKSEETLIVRDAYINLMREITINFSTEEEKKFIINADFNDDSDLMNDVPIGEWAEDGELGFFGSIFKSIKNIFSNIWNMFLELLFGVIIIFVLLCLIYFIFKCVFTKLAK
jgi:hypothetical protein